MKMEHHRSIVMASLAGLAIALLVVGLVSGTVLRHVVQIVPIAAALAFVSRRPAIGAFAALPVSVFWIFIVSLIWLFLMGLSRIANGHDTLAEILSTFVMAICCVCGVVRAIPMARSAPGAARVVTFAGFAALQIAAMWIRFTPSIANR